MTNFVLIILSAVVLAVFLAFIIIVLYPSEKSEETVVFKGWVAREGDGDLWFFKKKPIRDEKTETWEISPDDDGWFFSLQEDQSAYPIVWWDEPREIEVVIRPKSEEVEVMDEYEEEL